MPDFSLGIRIQSLSSVKINDIPPVRTVGGYQQEVDRLVKNEDSEWAPFSQMWTILQSTSAYNKRWLQSSSPLLEPYWHCWFSSAYQGSANSSRYTKSRLTLVLWIKFYWDMAIPIHLCIVSGFIATVAEMNSCHSELKSSILYISHSGLLCNNNIS